MKDIIVEKTEELRGDVTIQGSKNTVLPIMAATLLGSGISVIYNCPMIEDVMVMCELLECLHAKTRWENHVLTIDTSDVQYAPLPCSLTTKLRSSVLLLGPILARWKKVELGVPGGCAIGARPLDIHLSGLRKMNADIHIQDDLLVGKAYHLQGGVIQLRFPSVGATENLIMAAVVANGRTILRGVAKEPEIIELCNYLISMGALIEGVGTDVLMIKGTGQLTASDYCNVYDRIVAGTYLLTAAVIPSDIRLHGIDDIRYIKNIIKVAAHLGANVIKRENYLHIQSLGKVENGNFKTGIYPAFPTDLLPVLITVLTQSEGESYIEETIFENRLSIIHELKRLGAKCDVDGCTVHISSRNILRAGVLVATDLRQGAALVVAGMLSKGMSKVTHTEYIARGYENIVADFEQLGVPIKYA